MTYQSARPGYPAPQQTGGFPATVAPAGPSKLPNLLTGGVALLGLAAYAVSFGPQVITEGGSFSRSLGDPYWALAALLAGLLAAVSLLPKVSSYLPVAAVLSVLAFLRVPSVMFSDAFGDSKIGWALWVALPLTLVQAGLAVAALLLETGVISPPAPRQPSPQNAQYPQYGQAPAYYGQQAAPAQIPGQYPGYAPQQSVAPGGYAPAGYAQPDTSSDTPPSGFPGYGQQPQADPSGQGPS